MAERYSGRVKWFNAAKGFGFIERDGGADLFVHFSEITASGYRDIVQGEEVEFGIKDTPRGEQACQVIRLNLQR